MNIHFDNMPFNKNLGWPLGMIMISIGLLGSLLVGFNHIENFFFRSSSTGFVLIGCIFIAYRGKSLTNQFASFFVAVLIFSWVTFIVYLQVWGSFKDNPHFWFSLTYNVLFCSIFLLIKLLLHNQIKSFWNYLWTIISNRHVLKAITAFLFTYLSILFLFGLIYNTIYLLCGSKSFNTNIGDLNFLHFLYFSVVTSTTLGYGDITPISPTAIIFCIIEVVVSVILVGLYLGSVISVLSNLKSSTTQDLDP